MLRIAICEDAQTDIAHINSLLENYKNLHSHLELQLGHFQTGQALLDALAQGQSFDLFLLDILLPDIDGIELARRINAGGKKQTIIFMTVSRDYAVEAFSVRAMHYLLKPVQYEAFAAALDELVKTMRHRVETYASVCTPYGERRVTLSEIVYVEVTGHVFYYHLSSGETIKSKVLRVSFEEALAELRGDWRFLRPHQSFLLNACHVSKLHAREFIMDNGASIPISRLRALEVRSSYMDFLNTRSAQNCAF